MDILTFSPEHHAPRTRGAEGLCTDCPVEDLQPAVQSVHHDPVGIYVHGWWASYCSQHAL